MFSRWREELGVKGLTDVLSLLALKSSSGDQSFPLSMECGQCPLPSSSVPQANLVQERSHSQS